ncbi:N/A [soil metagenome]
MEFSITNLLLVLLAGWLGGLLAARLGYPAVLGELLAGIVLGPPLLGVLHGSGALAVLADLGVLLMMFYVGMEVDPRELARASWTGFLASMGGFIVPFALSYWVALQFGVPNTAALFIGLAAGVTALATKSRVLLDLNILDTRIANVMMAGAIITDTLSLLVFAGLLSSASLGGLELAGLALMLAKVALFFGASYVVGLKLFPRLWRWLSARGLTSRTFSATLVLMTALVFAEFAEVAGLHGVLGAFMAGLFLREAISERKLSHELTHMVRDVSVGFLAPVFFVTAGFQASFGVFTTDLGLLLSILATATVGKIVGTALFYLPSGYGWREGVAVGLGMNGRGAVEIILAGIALNAGLITPNIFSILVFVAIITTAADTVLLKWGVGWLARRGELVKVATRERVIVVGAGPVARVLAAALAETRPVCVIDANLTHCRRARTLGLTAVCGDALEQSTLFEAGVDEAGTLITVTPKSEVTLLAAQLAREAFLVPELFVAVTDNPDSGLHRLLAELEATPLTLTPSDVSLWDARLERQQADVVQGLTDLMTDALSLPLVVRRGTARLLYSEAGYRPEDEVVGLQLKRSPDAVPVGALG